MPLASPPASCAGEFRHLRRDLDFAHVGTTGRFLDRGQILFDGIVNVIERFLLGLSLRPAAGQAGAVDALASARRDRHDVVLSRLVANPNEPSQQEFRPLLGCAATRFRLIADGWKLRDYL